MPESSNPYRKDSSIAAPAAGGAQPVPSVGDVVGDKYRIETVIGQGGMGAVFRARHLLTERAVALKWMLPEVGGDEAVQRFLREARAMGRIDHAGVVGVLDVGVDHGATFLVMELLKGSSLREMLEVHGRFDPPEALGLLMPALEGVEAAHRAGVVHRDLKPENIFIVRSGDGTIETTKVLDFGISKLRDDRLDHSPQVDIKRGGLVTRTGVTIGTPSYMSPEQVRGSRDIDGRTDVWSLGVILYELLTGDVPFRAESFGALLVAIATESFPPLDTVRPELPPALVATVHRALEKEPSRRFADVASLALALEPFGPPGMRFRTPDVARPTEPSLEALPKPARAEPARAPARAAEPATAVAKHRPAEPELETAHAKPAPPATRDGFGELDLAPPRAVAATAKTALAPAAPRAAPPTPQLDTPQIPSLPPLALEDVPRRAVAAEPRPAPRVAPRAPEPAPEPPADPMRWAKVGVAILVGVIVLAVGIRAVVARVRPDPTAPVVAEPGPAPSPPPTARPVTPRPTPRPPAPWPPTTATGTGETPAIAIDPAHFPGDEPTARGDAPERAGSERTRSGARASSRGSSSAATATPASPPATAPATTTPAPPSAPTGTMTTETPSGRTGSLSRDDF